MLKAIEADLSGRFADVKEDMILGMAYTCSREEAQEWKKEIQERFPGYEMLEGTIVAERCMPHRTGRNGGHMHEKDLNPETQILITACLYSF